MNGKLRKLFSLGLIVVFVIALFASCSEAADKKVEAEQEERTAKQVLNAVKSKTTDINALDMDMDMDFDVTADGENVKAGIKLGMKADGKGENLSVILDLSQCPEELMSSLSELFKAVGIDISKADNKKVTLTFVDKVLYAEAFGEKVKMDMKDLDLSKEDILEQFTPSNVDVPDIDFKDLFSKSDSELEKFILKQAKVETKGTDSIVTITFDKEGVVKLMEIAKEQEDSGMEDVDKSIAEIKKMDNFDLVISFVVDKDDLPKEMNVKISMAGLQNDTKFDGKVEFKIALNNFGKSVEVTAPSDASSYVDFETYVKQNETLLNSIAGLNGAGMGTAS